jgi:hypothetical protein
MRFDPNVVFLGELHCRAHVIEVGGVKATGDIGDVDREAPDAETLAHVAIQEDHQRLRHSRMNKVTKTGAIVKSVAPCAELVSRAFAETIRIRTVGAPQQIEQRLCDPCSRRRAYSESSFLPGPWASEAPTQPQRVRARDPLEAFAHV